MASAREIESGGFRVLNSLTKPCIRLGFGSSSLLPAGLTVLETTGRVSGKKHETALQALFFQGGAMVGTYRGGRSDWLRNVRKEPSVRYWVDGRAREALAEFYPGLAGWAIVVLRDSK